MVRRSLSVAAAITMAAGIVLPGAAQAAPAKDMKDAKEPILTARSVLPTATFTPASEKSGYWTQGAGDIRPPYPGQPVQGFSATHRLGDGSYLVMSDNGFGNQRNSADALLAVHRIRPNAAPSEKLGGATGETDYINTVFTLSDPFNQISWQIWRDGGCTSAAQLPTGYTCPTTDRELTGADFDLESMQVAPDGTFWFGEEFGPFLLHTDAQGRLLEPPIPTPGVKSPSNPILRTGEKANLRDSKGFEGMAISPDGRTLYPMLEGATDEDIAAGKPGDLRVYTVRIGKDGKGAKYEKGFVRYRLDDPANAIGDFIAVNDHQFLVIERDSKEGAEAKYKKVHLVDMKKVDKGGYLAKTELVDLMNLADPNNVAGTGGRFTFPYFTIEDVEIIDERRIAIMNDNNFPATGGRGKDVNDVNEYLEITLPTALKVDKRLLPDFVQYGPLPTKKTKDNTFAVIGDLPYGEKQNALFSGWIKDINKGKPAYTVHVGDTKSGSTKCDDTHYSWMKSMFNTFAMPLIYSPGDNEWTDCHRPNNGAFNPLERLAKIRSTYFSTPGATLGSGDMKVASQAAYGVPENARWNRDGIQFVTNHIVGSNDGKLPWTGQTAPNAEQLADQKQRMNNAIQQTQQAFADARAKKSRAVVVFQQANMFDPSYAPQPGANDAFNEYVQVLVTEASRFKGEVYLFDGDSHIFDTDSPLVEGSKWLSFYGIKGSAENLTRITVDGSENNTNWLQVTVNKGKKNVLSWKQQPYTVTPYTAAK